MSQPKESLKPSSNTHRSLRARLTLRQELILALLPTLVVLLVLAFVEVLTQQRLLFASLASSAFLIYLDPQHGTNSVRTLVLSHMIGAMIGWAMFVAAGSGYVSGGLAMVATIVLMIVLDLVHPPAVSTSVSFALRAGDASNLVLFALAVAITAVLVILENAALRLLAHFQKRSDGPRIAIGNDER